MAAKDIFGPDTRCLQGKMVRKDEKAVKMMITPIPPTILERYKEATQVGDIMKVNSICFINTMSLNLKFITCENIKNAKKTTLQTSLTH
eukprot:12193518-Ditylum_brightwellii.AAC.1